MLRSWTGRLCLFVCLTLVSAVSANEAIKESDVSFVAAVDGTEQRYILQEPANFKADAQHDILIALHGHGSDRWQFAKHPLAEGQAARNIAAKYSMLYVSPDYRAKTSWMGPKAEADVVQIIGDLKKKFRVGRVFICGGSMGGTSALTFAALHPELIDGVAAMNGTANLLEYGNFQEAISESYGGPKKSIPDEYKKRSSEYWPERLVMPVAIATGGLDTLVPPDSCRRLAAILKLLERDVLIIHRDQGGHSTNLEDSTAILEFMMQKAKPAAAVKD
ncbi:MAG: alpha/beta fold hydrolase [Planctomycetota bacterium]